MRRMRLQTPAILSFCFFVSLAWRWLLWGCIGLSVYRLSGRRFQRVNVWVLLL